MPALTSLETNPMPPDPTRANSSTPISSELQRLDELLDCLDRVIGDVEIRTGSVLTPIEAVTASLGEALKEVRTTSDVAAHLRDSGNRLDLMTVALAALASRIEL